MPDTFTLGQNYDVTGIAPDMLATVMEDDWLMNLAPPKFSDTSLVVWEMPENGYGLLSLKGEGAHPDVTDVPGYRRMTMAPGYYGETVLIKEDEMNNAREIGSTHEPMDIEKRVGYIQEQIVKRSFDRMRTLVSALARTGQFLVTRTDGAVTHTDTLEGYSSRNVFTPGVSWSLSGTATPIDDLQTWRNQLQLGTDSRFDENSELGMSSPTLTDLLATAQVRSQIKIDYGNSVASLKKLNELLAGYNLPKIVLYDDSYYATKAAAVARTGAVRFIPAKSFIWKGYRKDSSPVAEFQLTRNSVKDAMAGDAQLAPGYEWAPKGRTAVGGEIAKGMYTLLQRQLIPAQYRVDIGFNGGIAVKYPSAWAGGSYT